MKLAKIESGPREEGKEGRNRKGRESFGNLGCQLDARSLIPSLADRPSGSGRRRRRRGDWAGRGMHIKEGRKADY